MRGLRELNGVLEYDLSPPAKCTKPSAVHRTEVFAVEDDLARGRLDEAQDGPARGGLAASGFTDEPQRLAPAKLEADAVHRLHVPHVSSEHPPLNREVLLQLADLEKDVAGRQVSVVRPWSHVGSPVGSEGVSSAVAESGGLEPGTASSSSQPTAPPLPGPSAARASHRGSDPRREDTALGNGTPPAS